MYHIKRKSDGLYLSLRDNGKGVHYHNPLFTWFKPFVFTTNSAYNADRTLNLMPSLKELGFEVVFED